MSRVLHLSDTHLTAPGSLHQGLVDTTAALRNLLAGLAGAGDLDAVVVSGDVSDDGSTASYETVRELVGAFAAEHGALAVFAMGNHDLPGPFSEVLGPVRGVHDVDGLRIVVLDSSVPGRGYGLIGAEQLRWLRGVLAEPAPRGSALVVHHPVVAAPTVLHDGLRLQDPDELLEVLEGSDVRAVLSGHYHHPFVEALDSGITAVVAPGVANRNDVLVAPGRERAVRGSGAALVELLDEGVRTTVLAVPGPGDGEELFVLPQDVVARIVAEAGPAAG